MSKPRRVTVRCPLCDWWGVGEFRPGLLCMNGSRPDCDGQLVYYANSLRVWIDRTFHLEEINGHGVCPTYLYRWTLLKLGKFFSVYLHKFVGDDWSLDLHDHPKRFWSIGLHGWYVEWTPCHLETCVTGGPHGRRFTAPWFRTFPAEHIHRLSGPTPEKPCWTLVIVGTPVRAWGFWHLGAFVPWKQYVKSADAVERKSCL